MRPDPMVSPADMSSLDTESRWWLESLQAEGQAREEVVAQLHGLLLRAARFEIARRRGSLSDVDRSELDDLAVQSADDALLAVLAKLAEFRGNSRFTTWAYKFALLETAVKLRRRPWQMREIPVEPAEWVRLAANGRALEAEVGDRELLAAVTRAIRTELTPHQREVLLAVAVGDVPLDVLAERLTTTRGALYKTIHDARQKLRRRLAAEGYQIDRASEGAPR
jgi:RNA polymerase sigma-70 factor, ECF subfamily